MLRNIIGILVIFTLLSLVINHSTVLAKEQPLNSFDAKRNLSFKKEIEHAVERGLMWLQAKQNPKGFWSQPDYPALTALVLTAFMREPSSRYSLKPNSFIQKGYDYLLSTVKPDGGIYGTGLANYNTAVSIMALLVANNPRYEPIMRNARNFIVTLQATPETGDTKDDPYYGGVGYGDKYKHSDMSNTMFALEALYYTRYLVSDKRQGAELRELNWPAAIKFIQRCQNLPQYNDQPWASDDPQNKGGFVYFPGDSKAGEIARFPQEKRRCARTAASAMQAC